MEGRRDKNTFEEKPYYEESTEWQAGAFKRISWGAVFAGLVVAFVVQLVLNLLGIAIGFEIIDVVTEEQPLSGLGVGAGIWLLVTTVLALLAGGWTAGRMAGFPGRKIAMLHGVLTWSLASFVSFVMVATGTGAIVSGALNAVQGGVQLLGQGIASTSVEVPASNDGAVSFERLKEEVYTSLRQTGREELQPANLEQRAEDAIQTTREAAREVLLTPADARQDIEAALDRLIGQGTTVIEAVDREAVVNVLVARTDMTREEAARTVAQYEDIIAEAKQRLDGQIQEQTAQTLNAVVDSMATAAWWSFFSMVIGAIASAFGGALGAPQTVPVLEEKTREYVAA